MTEVPVSAAATDLSVYVLEALDAHLRALAHIRENMRLGSTIDLGGRRTLAAQSAVLAAQFADAVGQALGDNTTT
jgi:hypothetical protein